MCVVVIGEKMTQEEFDKLKKLFEDSKVDMYLPLGIKTIYNIEPTVFTENSNMFAGLINAFLKAVRRAS